MGERSRINVGLDHHDGIVLMVDGVGYALTEELAGHIADAIFQAVRLRKLRRQEQDENLHGT